MYKNGKTYQEIGDTFNISRQRVHQIITGYITQSGTRFKESRKLYRNKIRNKILIGYGGKCVACGLDNLKCLEIDHLHDNGAEEGKKLGKANETFYRELIKRNFPKEYQLLCRNCNWLKYLKYLENKK